MGDLCENVVKPAERHTTTKAPHGHSARCAKGREAGDTADDDDGTALGRLGSSRGCTRVLWVYRGTVKGSPKCFLAKCFFGGLGYQGKQKTTHCQETYGFMALPKTILFLNMCVFVGPGTPGLQKPLGPKTTSGSL